MSSLNPDVKKKTCKELADIYRLLRFRSEYSEMLGSSDHDIELLNTALSAVALAHESLCQYNWEVI